MGDNRADLLAKRVSADCLIENHEATIHKLHYTVVDEAITYHVMVRIPDLSLHSMMDGGVITAMEKNLNSQVVDGNVEICSLSNGLSSQFSSYPGEFEKENGSVDTNTVLTTTKVTGLHELLMLAEEFESEEVTEHKQAEEKAIVQDSTDTNVEAYDAKKNQSEVHDSSTGQSNVAHEKKNEVSKGNGSISNHHLTESKSHRSSSSVLGKGGNGCSQMQKSRLFHPTTSVKGVVKVATRGSIDLSSHGNMGEKSQLEHVEVTMSAADSSVHQPTKNGTARLKYTVPQPFALATDKRASTGVRPVDVVASDVNRRMGARAAPSSSVPKKDKMSAKLDTQTAYNPLLSENLHLHDQNVNPPMQVNTKHEEDADSIFSSTASAKSTRDSKGKTSSAPSGAVFSFRCNERAEKRKEFFTKFEEKLSAKEAEKNQLQVKRKELQEVEIKMLRKSLTFKASPMPSFYHEAAPPKVELKKIPLTRPKSPKLGRRKSYAGVESESDPNQVCRTPRFSLDQKKSNGYLQNHTGEEHMKTTADKDMAGKRTAGRSLKNMPSEKSLTTSSERPFSPKPEISNSPKEGPVDESTKDSNLITSTDSNNSSGRRSDMKGLILQISVAVEEQEETKPLDRKNGIVSTANDRDAETLQNSEVVEEPNGTESINRKNEIAKTTGVGITVQKSEAIEEPIEEISGGKNKMAETKVQGDILEDSGSLIDTSEDGNSRPGFVTGVLAENLQGTDGWHLESESHSRVNPRKGRIQGNNTNMKQMEPKFVRSSQHGSAEETNGKGIKNPRREQLKAMTPYFKNSKRENGRTTSSKKIGKGSDDMIRTMSDVSVQS